jgi:hypothetical protein
MRTTRFLAALLTSVFCIVPSAAPAGIAGTRRVAAGEAVLWRNPVDISSRDLFHGPGRATEAPRAPFIFLEEDLDGTNPKFSVRDHNGAKWKVKLGVEARPEVAAARIVWAAGYYTEDFYFLPEFRVENLPELKRGQDLLGPDGAFYGVRLKREPDSIKKIGTWSWRKNPFFGTREFNGLRVLMALINNWDLKSVNNAVYQASGARSAESTEIYGISDLGASFGTSNWIRPLDHAKGNLVSYNESTFIKKVTDHYVDFEIATRPAIINAVNLPLYMKYVKMGWIVKHIPRADAHWMGQLLSRLSENQIRSAFRTAGYSPHEVDGFTAVLLYRIAELKKL